MVAHETKRLAANLLRGSPIAIQDSRLQPLSILAFTATLSSIRNPLQMEGLGICIVIFSILSISSTFSDKVGYVSCHRSVEVSRVFRVVLTFFIGELSCMVWCYGCMKSPKHSCRMIFYFFFKSYSSPAIEYSRYDERCYEDQLTRNAHNLEL